MAALQQHQAPFTLLLHVFLLQGQPLSTDICASSAETRSDFTQTVLTTDIHTPVRLISFCQVSRHEATRAVPAQGLPCQVWPYAVCECWPQLHGEAGNWVRVEEQGCLGPALVQGRWSSSHSFSSLTDNQHEKTAVPMYRWESGLYLPLSQGACKGRGVSYLSSPLRL